MPSACFSNERGFKSPLVDSPCPCIHTRMHLEAPACSWLWSKNHSTTCSGSSLHDADQRVAAHVKRQTNTYRVWDWHDLDRLEIIVKLAVRTASATSRSMLVSVCESLVRISHDSWWRVRMTQRPNAFSNGCVWQRIPAHIFKVVPSAQTVIQWCNSTHPSPLVCTDQLQN